MDSISEWKSYQKRRDTHEGFAIRRIMRGLAEQIRNVLDVLPDGASQTLGNLPYLLTEEPLQRAYIDIYTRVGGDFARRSFNRLNSLKMRKDIDNDWLEYLRNFVLTETGVRKRIKLVSGVTLKRLRAELERGISEGMGIEEIARNIERSNVVNRVRARVIARTEIVSASNEGSQRGAYSTGLDLNKIWVATPDERTRPTHWALDGETIGMNDTFIVGGDEAQYPGDANLSAEEAINCRCVIVHEPV